MCRCAIAHPINAADLAHLEAMRTALEQEAERAEDEGLEFLAGGDLQAQTAQALAQWGAGSGNEYDVWLEKWTTEANVASLGEVDVTYSAGAGGAQTAIDHWLATPGLAARAVVEVGAGADGLWTGLCAVMKTKD